uniref:Major facilitator superfamily (MFS) profile domain-containing protein n=2 Tax=Acrobeloides nanus TaxID=290746 RepID=A0A914DR38_9BILA
MHALSWTFSAASLPHRCRLEQESEDTIYWLPTRPEELSIADCKSNDPHHPQDNHCLYNSCILNGTKECPYGYVYNFDEIKNSAINRWEIVCDRHFLKSFIQSMYYVGQLIGAIVFGSLGDRLGRKKIVFTAMILEIVCGFALAFSPHWSLFAIARIGVGMAHPAITSTCIVIGMELVGPFGRRYGSLISGGFFSLGHMLLACIAYFVRDYVYLQLVLAIPAICFLSYWWLLPESPRWLVSQRRYKEADKILRCAAKINKTTIPDDWWQQIDNQVENKE